MFYATGTTRAVAPSLPRLICRSKMMKSSEVHRMRPWTTRTVDHLCPHIYIWFRQIFKAICSLSFLNVYYVIDFTVQCDLFPPTINNKKVSMQKLNTSIPKISLFTESFFVHTSKLILLWGREVYIEYFLHWNYVLSIHLFIYWIILFYVFIFLMFVCIMCCSICTCMYTTFQLWSNIHTNFHKQLAGLSTSSNFEWVTYLEGQRSKVIEHIPVAFVSLQQIVYEF
jgi:hypothetical protein